MQCTKVYPYIETVHTDNLQQLATQGDVHINRADLRLSSTYIAYACLVEPVCDMGMGLDNILL